MDAVVDRATRLPVLVVDSVLPGQVLRIETHDEAFLELVRQLTSEHHDGSTFAMVGMIAWDGSSSAPCDVGTEMSIVGQPDFSSATPWHWETVRVVLRAGRRLRITGEVESKDRWMVARVAFEDDFEVSERGPLFREEGRAPTELAQAMILSEQFTSSSSSVSLSSSSASLTANAAGRTAAAAMLVTAKGGEEEDDDEEPAAGLVQQWVKLAQERERQPGQLARHLEDMGVELEGYSYDEEGCLPLSEFVAKAVPPSTRPSDRAFWIGALINGAELQQMGLVAPDVRMLLLLSRTPLERVNAALRGIRSSIGQMEMKTDCLYGFGYESPFGPFGKEQHWTERC